MRAGICFLKGRAMIAKVNGQETQVEEGSSLEQFLAQRKISAKTAVVEHNARIVPPQEWPEVILKEEDTLEIVSFVGGG